MATVEEMEVALTSLRNQEQTMLTERNRLRADADAKNAELKAYAAEYKVVKNARGELERLIEEARSPRPVADATNVKIASAVAEAASGAEKPSKETQ
jgi:hypothetical protein